MSAYDDMIKAHWPRARVSEGRARVISLAGVRHVPPRYPWADVCLPHEGFFMVAYVQLLCNCFPVRPSPGRRRSAAASRRPWDHPRGVARLWRMLNLAQAACLQRSLHAARAHLSTTHRHLTRLDSPMQPSAPRLVWALQARSMCRRYGLSTMPSATRARYRGCASRCSRLRRSDAPGAEGQRVLGLAGCGEKQPRGLRRSAPWFEEKCSVV